MNKNFYLSIPKKRLRTARFKWGKFFSKLVTRSNKCQRLRQAKFNKTTAGVFMSVVMLCALTLPQTSFAENENSQACSMPVRGTIYVDQEGVPDIDESPLGPDYKITCTGALDGGLTNASIQSVLDSLTGFEEGTSKVLLDISGVTSKNPRIYFVSDAALNVLKGSLTNDDTVRDGWAVSVQGEDPATNDGTAYDVVVHNRAEEITVQGEGRRGVRVVHEHDVSTENGAGGSATLVNYGAVTTEGDSFIRPPDRMHRDRRTNALEAIVEGGTGNAMVTNEVGATVLTKGTGGRGLHAWTGGTGTATAVNLGMVTTEGDVFEGSEFAQSSHGVNASSGGEEVETSGAVKAENEGTIITRGYRANGLNASSVAADTPGKATVTNKDGLITTHGSNAHGMRTWVRGAAGKKHEAEGTNSGIIITNGANADGMVIFAYGNTYENTESPSSVTATNSGMIEVNGDSEGDDIYANGIHAGFWMDRDGDALGTVTVTNTGTVTTAGKSAGAIAAGFYAAQGHTIQNSGDVVINIEDGSTVEASGSNSVAVIADTHGSGNIEINVNNSNTNPAKVVEITAGAEDDRETEVNDGKFGYGIYATANTASSESEDVNNDDDVVITIEGAINTDDSRNITIQAYGAATDDTSTTGIDETKGIAIYADSGDMVKGRSRISLKNAHVVGGEKESGSGYAVMFAGGSGTLIVDNSKLEGDILFTDADDKLIINNSGNCLEDVYDDCAQFTGTTRPNGGSSIHFGDGTDVMEINANHFTMEGIDITGSPTIKFNDNGGGDRTLTLRDVRFNANINFSKGADDKLTLGAADRDSSINGDIDFGGGDDELTFKVGNGKTFDLMGNIDGLEEMVKQGPGTARINKVKFTGSRLSLLQGKLIVSGDLNLGADGMLIIEDAGKLAFEITGSDQDGVNHGKVTARELTFRSEDSDKQEVFVQLSNHLTDKEVDRVQDALADLEDGLDLLTVAEVNTGDHSTTVLVKSEPTEGGTPIQVGTITLNQGAAGMAVFTSAETVAMIEKTGVDAVAPVDAPPSRGMTQNPGSDGMTGGDDMTDGDDMMTGGATTTASSGSSSNAGGAVLGIGLLAVLLNSFLGDDDASASFGDYYFNTPQSAYIASVNERGVMTIKETGNQPYQMWIRTGHTAQPMQMTGVSNTGVSGTEVGFNLYNSDTFYINTSVAPNVAAEVGSLNLAGKGEVYSLNSGWRNDRYFAGLRLSHGEFEVNSIVDNPIVNSALISNAKLRNTQAQLRAGMNISTGALRFTPSAAVQVGTYESSEHVADSPALEAAIPSYAQDYTSVQLGLKMTSDKWLSFANGSKWKPQLKFDSIHTDSKDAGSLTLRQSDKAGALSFNTNAGLRSMPDVVNSMGFGAKVKSSANDQGEWKFGFAGLEADGEEYYAAMAAYQLKF